MINETIYTFSHVRKKRAIKHKHFEYQTIQNSLQNIRYVHYGTSLYQSNDYYYIQLTSQSEIFYTIIFS
jgi:hypothetical protein